MNRCARLLLCLLLLLPCFASAEHWSATGEAKATPAWQLPFDSFDGVMDAEMVAPRPVDELKSAQAMNSPYLWGHPEFDFVRPLHARAGAWPYHWEVVSGPPGTSIGAFPQAFGDGTFEADPQSYSMLHVPRQPEGSVSTVVVRMRDQNWNRGSRPSGEILVELEITWQADRWVVVSPDGEPGAAGTADDPLNGDEFWDQVQTLETFADKLVLLRGGDYGVINKSISLDDDSKPVVFMAAPGETPVLRELFLQLSAPDASIMGLEFNQPFQRYNQYFIRVWGTHPRVTITSNIFVGLTPGNAPGTGDGQDNPSAIMTTATADDTRRTYLTIARNHFRAFTGANERPNFAAFITYSNSHSVFEMNRLADSEVMEGFFAKGAHYRTTIRANIVDPDVSVSDSRGGLTAVHFPRANEDGVLTGFVEHCWNRTSTGSLGLLDRAADMDSIQPNPNYLYRNTGNGVMVHSKQRQFIRWHVFNNVTMGAYGVATDKPSGRWPSTIGIWPVQNGNAHIKNDLFAANRLLGGASRVEGFKGSLLQSVATPWPEQTVFDGIGNITTFAALGDKTLPVVIGNAGSNRMLMVVSFQSGGNGRGQGYHLDAIHPS